MLNVCDFHGELRPLLQSIILASDVTKRLRDPF